MMRLLLEEEKWLLRTIHRKQSREDQTNQTIITKKIK